MIAGEAKVPNHATIAWFRSLHFVPCVQRIMAEVAECEALDGLKLVYGSQIKIKHVKKLRKKLYVLKTEERIEFVYGSGK